ncbi:MAG: MarR family transcriptional regulator [Chloroflexota bacterium]
MSDTLVDGEIDEILKLVIAMGRYRQHIMATLPEEITRMKRQLSTQIAAKELRHGSITPDHFYRISMAILSQYKELMPMGELSKALDVPLSTATRIVDGLVQSGVAERLADPQDRRVVRVTLTEEGRSLHELLNNHMREHIDQLLSTFTSEERKTFVTLLGKIASNMDKVTL